MRATFVFLFLAAAAFAADADFNGRWDLTTVQPRPRGWWVELNGVGTPKAAGTFISAYAGDLNKINEISVANGEVKWVIAPPSDSKSPAKFVYRAKIVGGKLEGSLTREGQSTPPLQFTGVRVPGDPLQTNGSGRKRQFRVLGFRCW